MLQCHAKKKHPCRLSATQHAVIAPEMPSKASLQLYCEEFFTQYALNQNDNMRLGNLIITNNNKKKKLPYRHGCYSRTKNKSYKRHNVNKEKFTWKKLKINLYAQ